MKKKTVYVLEDEKNIQQLIKFNLENNGYDVFCFSTGKEFFLGLSRIIPSIILLDIMLPDTDGYVILSRLKSDPHYHGIPVIMITAKKEEFDKVLGLEMGSDDYITKPFSVKELLARVKVVLRRTENISIYPTGKIEYKDLVMDIDKHEFYRNNQLIKLSMKEFSLLEIFLRNPGKVYTRNQLLEQIWGFDYFGESRTVDVHIRYLRMHIGDENGRYIETIRGMGYKLAE
ncbi:MAG: response regulator transcription factor [Clostridia bacterium]|nr:response regulator transcription factor [Clostridia bacterium]